MNDSGRIQAIKVCEKETNTGQKVCDEAMNTTLEIARESEMGKIFESEMGTTLEIAMNEATMILKP